MVLDRNTDPELRTQILTYHLSGIMTDLERARLLGLPDGCKIRENARIFSPEKLKCGKNVWIGEGAILDASGNLEIGENTQIGLYCLLWTHTSRDQAISGETRTSKEKVIRAPTKIGKNCFIGGHSVIYPGVTIGDRVTIMPLSVVNRDVPDDSTVGGAPIGKMDDLKRRIEELEKRLGCVESKLKP